MISSLLLSFTSLLALQMGTAPLLKSWLASPAMKHLPDSMLQRLELLYTTFNVPLYRFLRREIKEASPTQDGSLATAWMRLWQGLAMPLIGEG